MYTWNDIKTGAQSVWNRIKPGLQSTWSWIKSKAYWIGIIVAVIIILVSFHGCASAPTPSAVAITQAPGAGWLFLKLAFAGLILVAYYAREHRYLAGIFAGLSVLVFLVLLGQLNKIADWGVLGLPLMAAFSIRGYGLLTAGTKLKSFLGFASGFIITFWIFLVCSEYSSKLLKLLPDGLKGIIFPDAISKVIGVVAVAILLFAIWKKSLLAYATFFLVVLSTSGTTIPPTNPEDKPTTLFAEITGRFPSGLTPPKELSEGAGTLLKASGNFMKDLPNKIERSFAPPPPAKTNPPPATTTQEKPAEQKAQTAKEAVNQEARAARPEQWMVRLAWLDNGQPVSIKKLLLKKNGSSATIQNDTFSAGLTCKNMSCSGKWKDSTGKYGDIIADLASNTGSFIGGKSFRIVRE